jgi:dipeptidyl aminopeptidase/acylaminoacyl peptidase
VQCPFLVLHGEHDRVVPVQAARDLYAAIGAPNKTMRIFTMEETGAEHCQVDNRQAGIDYIGDWLAQVL